MSHYKRSAVVAFSLLISLSPAQILASEIGVSSSGAPPSNAPSCETLVPDTHDQATVVPRKASTNSDQSPKASQDKSFSQNDDPSLFPPSALTPATFIRKDGTVGVRVADPEHPFGKIINALTRPITAYLEGESQTSVYLSRVVQRLEESLAKSNAKDQNSGHQPEYWTQVDAASAIKTQDNPEFIVESFRPLLSKEDLATGRKLPSGAGIVFVGNHTSSWELVRVAAIAEKMGAYKPRIVLNPGLRNLPGVSNHAIFLSPYATEAAKKFNESKKKEMTTHLQNGGTLVIAPSGSITRKQSIDQEYSIEPEWKVGMAHAIVQAPKNTYVVAWHSDYEPIQEFQEAQLTKSPLKTPAAIMKNIGQQVGAEQHRMRYSAPISREFLMKLGGLIDKEGNPTYKTDSDGKPVKGDVQYGEGLKKITAYLRARSNNLFDATITPPINEKRELKPIIEPVPYDIIKSELYQNRLAQTVFDSSPNKPEQGYEVVLAYGRHLSQTMKEIGRLRETTFREVGEGSGNASDIDSYDNSYLQFVLVDKAVKAKAERGERLSPGETVIAGGYRWGKTDELLLRYGNQGLYTTSLFEFPKLTRTTYAKNTIEAGRSFLVGKHQGGKALLVLWKGMAQFLVNEAEAGRVYTTLIGPVSLSQEYNDNVKLFLSRQLLKTRHNETISPNIKGKVPPQLNTRLTEEDIKILFEAHPDLNSLEPLIRDAMGDSALKLPPLFGLYSTLGADFVAASADPDFGCLDLMTHVDLAKTEPKWLQFYFGKDLAARYMSAVAAQSNQSKPKSKNESSN